PYIIGINATSFWPFFFIDWVGAFVWAVIFGVLGYLFGAATMHYMDEFSNYAKYIYLTAAVIIIFFVVKNRLIKFIQHRQESKASKSGLDVFL
ncbi:DedA family protein, partial [Fangia hongkongensis]